MNKEEFLKSKEARRKQLEKDLLHIDADVSKLELDAERVKNLKKKEEKIDQEVAVKKRGRPAKNK